MKTDDEVELDPERQRELIELEGRLESSNLFALLGVLDGAPPEEVRAAFREYSRRLHPDRFFGKALGPFKQRLERVYKRLIEAHQTLADPTRREAYLAAQPALKAAADAWAARGAPLEKGEEMLARMAERRRRLAQHPYLHKTARVKELLARARAAVAQKEFSQAYSMLTQLTEAAPENAEARGLLEEVRALNDAQRAAASFALGQEALSRADESRALQAFKLAASSGHAEGAFQAAALASRHGGAESKEAAGLAQRAVELSPANVEYRLLLARLLDEAGMKALSKKHFDEAARLDPRHPEVKKRVRKRWPF